MQASVIICTGGLGPTHDDITKDVLCAYFNDVLTENTVWLEHLTTFMQQRGRELSARNALQAMLPSTATMLFNPVGTAPGMLFERDGLVVVSLPGVPQEMKTIMTEHVVPHLTTMVAARDEAVWEYRTLHTTGIPEAALADVLGHPAAFLNNGTLAFLPNMSGVRLRIGVCARSADERTADLDRITSYIEQRAGKWVIGEGDTSLAEVVGRMLRARSETISVAESCTGGMLGAALTDIAGSSAYVEGGVITYSNAMKTALLGVDAHDLAMHGAVSETVARQMCEGVRRRCGTTYGVGITGVAGPDGGTAEKPVGTVWIGVAGPAATVVTMYRLGTDRRMNRERSVAAALAMVLSMMKGTDRAS
jgi:nicotinamide-nucleotide amidase